MTDAHRWAGRGRARARVAARPAGRRLRIAGRVHAEHRAGADRRDRRVPDPPLDHRRRRRRRRHRRRHLVDGPDDSPGRSVAPTAGGTTTPTVPTTPAPSHDRGDCVGRQRQRGRRARPAAMTPGARRRPATRWATPGDNTGGAELTTSIVYFALGDARPRRVARSVANRPRGVTTEAMPDPPPDRQGPRHVDGPADARHRPRRQDARRPPPRATPTTGAGGVAPPAAVGVTTTIAAGLITPSASPAACSMHQRGSRDVPGRRTARRADDLDPLACRRPRR